MKTRKRLVNYLSMIALFMVIIPVQEVLAQKKDRTRVRAYYEKLADGNLEIKVLVTAGSGRNMTNLVGADVEIFNTVNEERSLAVVTTNSEGEGILMIETGYPLVKDLDRFARLRAEFAGNDTLAGSDRDIEFKELFMDVDFVEEDSLKHIKIFAYEDSAGVKIPAEEVKVNIGVQRMLSVLNLETIETNRRGRAEFEFPADLPGDNEGNLRIIAKVVEDGTFGTVSQVNNIKWGTIVDYNNSNDGRSLFGDEAPLWMIIAVFIVLGGAWYHFIWAIIKVWSIKKLDS